MCNLDWFSQTWSHLEIHSNETYSRSIAKFQIFRLDKSMLLGQKYLMHQSTYNKDITRDPAEQTCHKTQNKKMQMLIANRQIHKWKLRSYIAMICT